MRRLLLYLAFTTLTLGAVKLPRDARAFMEKGIFHPTAEIKGWQAPARVPLDLVNYALLKTYGRKAKAIWPLEGKDHTLVAYAIDLEPAPIPKGEVHGIPPATSVIISAYLNRDAFIEELHQGSFSSMLPCRKPQRLVLTYGTAIAAKCGSHWRIVPGGKIVTKSWVSKYADFPPKDKTNPIKLTSTWKAFITGKAASSTKVLFEEFDEVYPIDHYYNWGLLYVNGIVNEWGYPNHHFYGYWAYEGNIIETIGIIASALKLRWIGEKYDFKKAHVQDDSVFSDPEDSLKINDPYYTYTFYCSYWLPLGVFIWPNPDMTPEEAGCTKDELSSAGAVLRPSVPWTLIPTPYWEFVRRNVYLWNHHRKYNKRYDVIVPFLARYGRYVNENNIKPPWARDVGYAKARQAWWEYLRERVSKQAIYLSPALNFTPFGVAGVISPTFTLAGWDDGKKLLATYSPQGVWFVSGPNGPSVVPPGYAWISPVRVGDWPAWLYPSPEFENQPPALAFPTRALVDEGQSLTLVADLHWDREGEEITWEVESSPFTIVEKGAWSVTFQIDRPEGNYVIWIKYTDGHNTVYHPVVVHVFPTFKFGEGK